MRLAWYAGASTALAAAVVISAFHQRANFYSAMVYLYQSNLCLVILVNLVFLAYSSFVYSLQRICFGQLRAVEVEQLYERGWFAITETCLAMTIFRDEFGGFFIVMFVSLLTGKVWGWIGEGRIEALEQQPPTNPRLFHTRLSVSLLLSLIYDASLLYYAISTVIAKARPDMMVMFLFEFALLLVTSLHTALRYSIIMFDIEITKRQTRERLEDRRRQVREERQEILRRRDAGEPDNGEPLPDEDDIDEMDIEVPGWDAKGQYVLGLDLWTDFTKLCIYSVFFAVLFYLYGLPLHIIRDLFVTVRSFIKRLGALMKYRQAIKDMNRYADATADDLSRENTCIICREDMHVWDANDAARIERTRPKRLPCGHILHLGCLKSWMERQQVCPTCRRSVVISDAAAAAAGVALAAQGRNPENAMFRFNVGVGAGAGGGDGAGAGAGAGAGVGANAPGAAVNGVPNAAFPGAHGQAPPAANNHPHQHQHQQAPPPPAGNGRGGLRMFNLGPFRLGFAQGAPQDVEEIARRFGMPPHGAAGQHVHHQGHHQGHLQGHPAGGLPEFAGLHGPAGGFPDGFFPPGQAFGGLPTPPTLLHSYSTSAESISADLRSVEDRIERGILELQIASEEVVVLRALLLELQRIRSGQAAHAASTPPAGTQPEPGAAPASPTVGAAAAPTTFGYPRAAQTHTPTAPPPSAVHLTTDGGISAIPSGSAELPAGVQIPAGWSLLPLRRFDNSSPSSGPSPSPSRPEAETTAQAGPSSGTSLSTPAGATPTSSQQAAASETVEEISVSAVPVAGSSSTTQETTTPTPTPAAAPPVWGGPAQLFGTPSEAAASQAEHDSDSEQGSSSDSASEA